MKRMTIGAAQEAVIAITRIERLIESGDVSMEGAIMITFAINKNVLIPGVQAYEVERSAMQSRVMGQSTPRDADFIAKQAALSKAAVALQNVEYDFPVKLFKLTDLDLKKSPRLGAMLAALAVLFGDDKSELVAPLVAPLVADVAEAVND